jgi:hypothetical protein
MMIAMFVTSNLKKDLRLIRLCPLFERFFILGGPRGTRQKKLQNLDSIIRLQDKRKSPRAFRRAKVKVSSFIRIGRGSEILRAAYGSSFVQRYMYGIIATTNRTKEFVGVI